MPAFTAKERLNACQNCELRSLRMFCNLDEDALRDFESIGTQRAVRAGTRLFSEAEPSSNVILICTGQVKLSCTSREGRTMILKIALPGDVLGLGAVISGSPFEVTAETTQPSQIKSIDRITFLRFLKRHGEASLHAAKALSADYQSTFFDVRRLALSASAAGRLAGVLLEWGRASSCGRPEMRFTLSLTHEELANMIGSSRETITRTLSRFRRDKLIEVNGSSIHILSPTALEDLAA